VNTPLLPEDLRPHHTFGLLARGERVESFGDVESLRTLLGSTPGPHLILGDGSNVAFVGDFHGTILLNRIPGRRMVDEGRDGARSVFSGAGEIWHDLVKWTLDQGLYGLENLSLIPGRVGAAPIQNIGAYGVELSDVFVGCSALDRMRDEVIELDRKACNFGYRESIFKKNLDRYIVLEVQLELKTTFAPKLEYGDLARRASLFGESLSGHQLSDLVCGIRQEKLPDPRELGNAGSFFKNPFVDEDLKNRLLQLDPAPSFHPVGGGLFKTSAAWLIDQCGLKGAREGAIEVHERQPLVIINRGGGTGSQLLCLVERIEEAVMGRYGIHLEREVRLVPSPEGGLA